MGAKALKKTANYAMNVPLSGNSTPAMIGNPSVGGLNGGLAAQTGSFQISSANQSLSSRTVSAANVAPAANGGSTKPSGSTSGGTTSSAGSSYTIRAGDTLGNIAYANNTSVSALMSANPQIRNANLIYSGSSINLPSSNTGNFGGFGGGTSRGSGASGRW